MQTDLRGTAFIPLGIGKKDLRTAGVNLSDLVAYSVAAQDVRETVSFVQELSRVCAAAVDTVVVDGERLISGLEKLPVTVVNSDYEAWVVALFSEMVLRNNTFKDARLDMASLEPFEERVYIIVGMASILNKLSADGREKLSLLLEKAESFYKLHFVIVDSVAQYGNYNYETWYKRQCNGIDGLWLGDGIADQYQIKVNKITSELYADLDAEFGYVVSRGKPVLVKLLSSREEEETDE